MIALGMIWAMLGPRSMAVLAVITLLLYGRSGVMQTRHARMLRSWLSPARRAPGPPAPASSPGPAPAGGMTRGDRTFWFLTALAAAALAAWIVTRTMIVAAPGVSH